MSEITAKAPGVPAPSPAGVEAASVPSPQQPLNLKAKPPSLRQLVKTALSAFASLRLTVILFVFAILIVFFGTLAQRPGHLSLWSSVTVYFRSFYVWVPLQIFFPESLKVPGGFPFPGGWLIGTLLLVNLLAAHAVRFKLSWKRSGILLIHAGLIIMMLGELFTGLFAVEGIMTIDEHKSSNFVVHHRSAELAIVDPSDPKEETVVVIPDGALKKEGTIRNDQLPFDVEVVRYMPNATLVDPGKATDEIKALSVEGTGKTIAAASQPLVTDNDLIDLPAAYVTFKDKKDGHQIGTFLFSTRLPDPEPVRINGKAYDVQLREKRTYKPFVIELKEVRNDLYPGTKIPRNYSSDVILMDSELGVKRTALIKMNEPLRYRGDTYYQSNYTENAAEDPLTGRPYMKKTTGLQVVHTPSWELPGAYVLSTADLPYVSCAVVFVGLVTHFGIALVSFLRKQLALV